jgi:hypothetical protein
MRPENAGARVRPTLLATSIALAGAGCATTGIVDGDTPDPKAVDTALVIAGALVGKGMDSIPERRADATPPPLRIDPPMINFGRVPTGSSMTRTIGITNDAARPVTVFGLSLSGPNFRLDSVPSMPVTLSPGGRLSLEIWFEPRGTCRCRGDFVIETDLPEPRQRLQVSGSAVDTR